MSDGSSDGERRMAMHRREMEWRIEELEAERDHWRAEHDRIVGVFEQDHHEQCAKRRAVERERKQQQERGDRYRRRALALVHQLAVIRALWWGAADDSERYRGLAERDRNHWRRRAKAMLRQARKARRKAAPSGPGL